MYEKNIDTSKYGDDNEYQNVNIPKVNEHGKQVVSEESPKTQVDLEGYAGWQASVQPLKPYYKINRSEGKSPIVSIEEVEITEAKDYSESDIIYDINKDGFGDDENKESFNIPISVSFSIPETTTIIDDPTTTFTDETTVTTEKFTTLSSETTETFSTTTATIPSTSEIIPTSSEMATTEEVPKPVTTYSRIYNVINRSRQPSV